MTAAENTTPAHSLEIERKYDVDDDTRVPDWSALPGVARVGEPEPRDLDARYFDTADAALAQALTALRRRTGGPDAGWHIKRSTPEGKLETQWPLEAGIERVPAGRVDAGDAADIAPLPPAAVIAALTEITAGPFAVVARIRNARTAYALYDTDGGVLAEFVDDRVTATDLRRRVETTWREWELELGPAAPTAATARAVLFAAADTLVERAGGHVSASGSKLARALGG
ncbi:CYTH domain-containing protein [Microbacterium invictum]|uniref:CYTH domain-containing protein n=1 Tax=Microbacterium invictum TaxID=515415 RepID=A0AA40SNM0_9MICO|nr:CYTH domain-containing protein [Microbacterium invictum]MBB4139410.1 hypothetical protein [Microbacterium invictum]